jgi:hypothetical protein
MNSLQRITTCLVFTLPALTGCFKQESMRQPEKIKRAYSGESAKNALRGMMNAPSSKVKFDDPESGYFQAYLLIQESDKAQNHKESIRLLKKAEEYLKAVKNKYPDWKPDMVNARIENTQRRLNSFSMNAANPK